MNLHRRRVERECFDLDAHHLLQLQLLKYTVQDPLLGPPVHAHIDRVPTPEPLWKPRHLQPRLATYKIAFSTCRLVRLTFPRCTGRLSWMRAYCSSVISILQTFYQPNVLIV